MSVRTTEMSCNKLSIEPSHQTLGARVGFIAAVVGSAVGLGNVWRFPYVAGKYGGGTFLFVYLGCVVFIGMTVMMCEFLIGRKTGLSSVKAFKKLAPKTAWFLTGWLGIITSILILSFYSCIAGWCIHYMMASLMNGFVGLDGVGITETFKTFISGYEPVAYQMLVLFVTALVVSFGRKSGIERFSKILMPVLIVLLALLGINSLLLPDASKGLEFLFKPDFSQLTSDTIMAALGHSFFTLSVGMGIMLTYGSSLKKSDNLGATVVSITLADTLIAILVGIIIFPAVFSFGINPGSGEGLVFLTFPQIFNQLPFGEVLGGLFFLLLTIAAVTSTISLLEVNVAYLQETFNWKRVKATSLATVVIAVTGAVCSLSNTVRVNHIKIMGLNLFDFADQITNNILLPVGGLLILVFTGYILKKQDILDELMIDGNKVWYAKPFLFTVKFIAPALIGMIFFNATGLLG